jgi:D-inositol-3-phosphate glycosyltransferase
VKVALLTGGKDPHYARGLLRELAATGVQVALIGSEELAGCEGAGTGRVEFHDLIGSQDPGDGLMAKAWRVLSYYARLVVFAARTDAKLFHVLWFRKFPLMERTLLNVYFKLLGKKLVLTAHNVDDRARDGRGRAFSDRLSLRCLYTAVDHILVHTRKMKAELIEEFGVAEEKVTVVPFGMNDVIPEASATRKAAREQLGVGPDERVLLFFGNITPYKGVEDLLRALAILVREDRRFTVILAGRVKDRSCEAYWAELESLIGELQLGNRVRKEIRYIPDGDVGLLFRASDVSVLPYRRVYQSGVLSLSYAQGLPVIAADVGSLREDIIEGETGLVSKSGDVLDLADKIRAYFASDLFKDLDSRRLKLREYGAEQFSWTRNAELTCAVYERLTRKLDQCSRASNGF